jgi:pyridinium-3,5-biscarboxylic acid mononucleotide synthase
MMSIPADGLDGRPSAAARPVIQDLGFARLDLDRDDRTGDPEVLFAAGKTPGEVVTILASLNEAHPGRAVLATRCTDPAAAACRERFGERCEIDERSGTVVLGPPPRAYGDVVVVAAGTSDLAVAGEALTTIAVFGAHGHLVTDVGVAGLHRLLAERDRIAAADAIVAVAGMEGALPSVIAGLVGVPLIAVPTSVGYGASFGGIAALLAMLNSCAAGVCVVNIDNGFGAGVAAARIARAVGRLRESAIADPRHA